MEELVNMVVKKTGISQDDAQKAVQVVIDCLKSKLPPAIANHLDTFMSGGLAGGLGVLEAEAGDMLKGKLSGLFADNTPPNQSAS